MVTKNNGLKWMNEKCDVVNRKVAFNYLSVKVVFEMENSTLDLCWILNIVITLWKCEHCEHFFDTGCAFWQDKHCQNFSAFLPLWQHHGLVERAFSVCGDKYTGRRNKWALTWNSMFFCEWTRNTSHVYCCTLLLLKCAYTHQLSSSVSFMFIF